MGVIQRQTIKNNIVAYAAVLIGALASIYIYPKDLALRGFGDALFKWVFLIGPIVSFGVHAVMVRFLPQLDEDKVVASQQLLTRALVVQTVSILLLCVVNWWLGDTIVAAFIDHGYNLGLLENYRWEVLLLLFPMVYSVTLTTHILNFQRIALPAVFNNLFLKMGLPVVFLLTVWKFLPRASYAYYLIALYALVFFFLLGVAWRMGILGFRWERLKLQSKSMKDVFSFAFFSLFSGIGVSLATHLDTVSVNTFLGNDATGVYSFAVFVIGTMLIPFKAINQICAPFVSSSWEKRDLAHLGVLYRDSASALFSAGLVIFVGCVVCLPGVYGFTEDTPQYAVGYVATLLLGGGQLINQLTSINDALITYTDHYRWMMVFVLLLGLLNLWMNYYFIGVLNLGLEGAALATLVALLIFNLAKVIFVYLRIGIHPFSISLLYVAVAAITIGWLVYLIPSAGNPYLDVGVRGGLVVVLFFVFFRFTTLVPVMHRALREGVKGAFG